MVLGPEENIMVLCALKEVLGGRGGLYFFRNNTGTDIFSPPKSAGYLYGFLHRGKLPIIVSLIFMMLFFHVRADCIVSFSPILTLWRLDMNCIIFCLLVVYRCKL